MNTAFGSRTTPQAGDYIQLLNGANEPCENHAEVDRWTAELGINLFLVEDVQGESFAVTRLEEYDNDRRNAWQQVITDAPTQAEQVRRLVMQEKSRLMGGRQ